LPATGATAARTAPKRPQCGFAFTDSHVRHIIASPGTRSLSSRQRAKTRALKNPKFEYRNSKQTQRLKSQSQNPKAVLELSHFDHLKLFRISDFEFAFFMLAVPFDPLLVIKKSIVY
jgi:hypothetical protein